MSMYTARGFKYPFERVSNDVNGNPRYVLHFLALADTYDKARVIANRMGWSAYRAKSHGGCFVGQSYSIEDTVKRIQDLQRELAAAERVIEAMRPTTYAVETTYTEVVTGRCLLHVEAASPDEARLKVEDGQFDVEAYLNTIAVKDFEADSSAITSVKEVAAAERVIEATNRTTYIVAGVDASMKDFYVAFDSPTDAEQRYQQEIDAGAYSVNVAEVIRSTDYEVAA